mgnify:CR=1 FL=1
MAAVHRDASRQLYRLDQGQAFRSSAAAASPAAPMPMPRFRAGASLVQVYSALVFRGTGLAQRIKRELARIACAPTALIVSLMRSAVTTVEIAGRIEEDAVGQVRI